jgi:hypothetical protein
VAHAEAGSARELKLALLLVAVLAAAGCGSSSNSSKSGTHLVVNSTGHPQKVIDCPGSDLCTRLERTPRAAFDPVPAKVACSQIYGGDQKATVKGTLKGDPIDASFSRENGCEIARWNRLSWLLGKTTQ